MISIKNYPNNRDEFVGAETLMKFLHGRTSGVFSLEDSAAVSAKQGGMAVTVSDGYGWITDNETNGCVWWVDAKKETGMAAELPIDPADSVLSRIDRVVVSWDTTLYKELPQLKILKGPKSSNPTPPVLTNTSTTRQISLAQIRVNAGALKITPADVKDERLDPSVCGLVTYSEKIDTEHLKGQVDSMIEQNEQELHASLSATQEESAALLKAIQDELAAIVGGSGYDSTPVRKENVTISLDMWSGYSAAPGAETRLFELGYSFRATVPIDGAIQSMYPYVTLDPADLEKAGVQIASAGQTYNGGIHLYAKGKPGRAITALTVELRKKVG